MNAPLSSSRKLRRILIIKIYIAFLFWGVVQVLAPEVGGLYYLFALVAGGSAAWWAVLDASDRGRPILHIVQFFVLLFWPLAVPVYLIASRGIRGFGLSVAHAVGLMLALLIGFYVTVFSLYGLDAYAS
ncbi:MAG: hypothetical protein AAGA30_13490 [Planctomycetota bacterium]